jgi:hypothetical protein
MSAQRSAAARVPQWLALLLVCLAGLLLEVGYTRIVSYKLWYYYTYLVIGLSLLGIGSGGIIVAMWAPIRRAATERIIALCSLWGAVSIVAGYLVIARIQIDTVAIWDYGTQASFTNLFALGVICFFVFSTFIALGIIVSTVLGRAREGVGRLYFADLLGAGIGCLLAIPLITRLGPPIVIMLAALIFAVVGLLALPRPAVESKRSVTRDRVILGLGAVVALALAGVVVAGEDTLPNIRTEDGKLNATGSEVLHSEWGPVFRVDVADAGLPNRLLVHDGTFGSGIWPFDGDTSKLSRFETDPRSIPFSVLGDPPERELIIGSAGGQEILASLYYDAPDIEAVELNPVTVGLLTDEFADYSGHLPERPDVRLHQGDGRSYLARSDSSYDLVWYVAPDSYAATNAASSGAFVLSESYLYTSEMIEETLEHLTDDGIMVAQFGELDFEGRSNRTSRYIVTARDALEKFGVDDPSQHVMVDFAPDQGNQSTIIVKRTPFTPAEVEGFGSGVGNLPGNQPIYAPGADFGDPDHITAQLAGGTHDDVESMVADHTREIDAITDDGPFFWHFSSFSDVLSDITKPLDTSDPEDVIGERVLLLLLLIAIAYAAVFLLLPFVAVRKTWSKLPSKGLSGIYFAALGLGFMLFEITMIQRLVLFLGYPTYSLTVTLASILVFTGIGALLSKRLIYRAGWAMPRILAALAVLTLFYQFGLGPLTDSMLSAGLGVRVFMAVVVLAPLGLCLGMFMPLGLGLVSRITDHGEEYAAWSWAVNGFFSVIGSVLTTILSMAFGFRAVQFGALAVYAVAVLAFVRLHRSAERADRADRAGRAGDGEPGTIGDVPGDAPVPVTPASTPV